MIKTYKVLLRHRGVFGMTRPRLKGTRSLNPHQLLGSSVGQVCSQNGEKIKQRQEVGWWSPSTRLCVLETKRLHVYIHFATISLAFFLSVHACLCVRAREGECNRDTGEELPLWLYTEALSWATVVCSGPLTTISLETNSATSEPCFCNSSSWEVAVHCQICDSWKTKHCKNCAKKKTKQYWLHQCRYSKSQITGFFKQHQRCAVAA